MPDLRLEQIRQHLGECKVRSGDEAYAAQMVEWRKLSAEPVPFHWVRGGQYVAYGEGNAIACDEVESEEGRRASLPLRPAGGLYVSRMERVNNAALLELCVGDFVVIDCRGDDDTELEWYLSEVVGLDVRDTTTVRVLRYTSRQTGKLTAATITAAIPTTPVTPVTDCIAITITPKRYCHSYHYCNRRGSVFPCGE